MVDRIYSVEYFQIMRSFLCLLINHVQNLEILIVYENVDDMTYIEIEFIIRSSGVAR